MRVAINENDIRRMVSECVRLLTEDREGKNINLARKFLETRGIDDLERRQEILDDVRRAIPNSRLAKCKFLLGVTRMYVDKELNARVKDRLNQTLEIIASDAHVNEYDSNLNGEKAITLIDRFSTAIASELSKAKAASDAQERVRNENYRIIPIDTPQAAAQYGKYTSWCVTHSSSMYNHYTKEGLGRFYFCLRNGFEREPEVKGDGCPLDSYGLSMIAVSVNSDGSVNTITCRWNHANGGNDNIMKVGQLEDLLGVNFYKTFVPYSSQELRQKGVIPLEEIQQELDNGADPNSLFKSISNFTNGYAVVETRSSRKYNFMSKDKKILFPDRWFDYATAFKKGLSKVTINWRRNIISKEGKCFIGDFNDIDTWPREIYGFHEGFARITFYGQEEYGWKENYVNEKGKLLYGTFDDKKDWFDTARTFSGGLGKVRKKNKYNFIKPNGKFLLKVWVNTYQKLYVGSNKYNALIKVGSKGNILTSDNKMVFKNWFDGLKKISYIEPGQWSRTQGLIIKTKGKMNIFYPATESFLFGNKKISTWPKDIKYVDDANSYWGDRVIIGVRQTDRDKYKLISLKDKKECPYLVDNFEKINNYFYFVTKDGVKNIMRKSDFHIELDRWVDSKSIIAIKTWWREYLFIKNGDVFDLFEISSNKLTKPLDNISEIEKIEDGEGRGDIARIKYKDVDGYYYLDYRGNIHR